MMVVSVMNMMVADRKVAEQEQSMMVVLEMSRMAVDMMVDVASE